MSQENVKLARDVFDAVTRRDASRLIELTAIELGTVVLLVGEVRYRGRESGVETADPAGWVLKFRSGHVLSFRAFHEPAEALEATGLREYRSGWRAAQPIDAVASPAAALL